MSGSGILDEALKVNISSIRNATHFALCGGGRIRYLIALKGGKKRLAGNLSSYSGKLGALMKILPYLPIAVLKFFGLGYFTNVELHPEIKEIIGKRDWNVIVGTYDEKQKLVIQVFDPTVPAQYIKIGNENTDEEMKAEIHFLRRYKKYNAFDLPKLSDSVLRDGQHQFNIMVTEEFEGSKVEPVLTREIIEIYREISSEKKMADGVEYEFSHGDFAPWNVKKKKETGYTVFDWEHCGFRVKGYDLAYFMTITEVALSGKSFEEGLAVGLEKIREFLPEFSIEKDEFMKEFRKTVKELSD